MITWSSERKLSKRKSYDNHHLRLHLGQFDFHFNASSSLTSIKPWVIFKLCNWFFLNLCTLFLLTYALRLCHWFGKASIYEPEEYSALVSICRSSTYEVMRFIILEHHLVTRNKQLIGCNQTFSFVKSSGQDVQVWWQRSTFIFIDIG